MVYGRRAPEDYSLKTCLLIALNADSTHHNLVRCHVPGALRSAPIIERTLSYAYVRLANKDNA